MSNPPPAGPPRLVLEDVDAIGPEGTAFELHADGSVVVGGEAVGTLGTDGRLEVPGEGVVAELRADGGLYARDRRIATIDASGLATLAGGETLRFGPDGALEWGAERPALRLNPPGSAAARAALLLVIVLMY